MEKTRFPAWMRRRVHKVAMAEETRKLLDYCGVRTVCRDARCPNWGECFAARTATFMILGRYCTRGCNFCAVPRGAPAARDPGEPERVARAAKMLNLRFVVVTSVTRDDLPDGGAGHFAAVVEAIRSHIAGAGVEILTPDFGGSPDAVKIAAGSRPDVYGHNVETVPRLYPVARPGADYRRSIELLARVKKDFPGILTKSGLMVGLGEDKTEVLAVMKDLRNAGCDLLTIGQYLQPSPRHLAVREFVKPVRFQEYRRQGLDLGFLNVLSGPYVRSSYRAGKQVGVFMPPE